MRQNYYSDYAVHAMHWYTRSLGVDEDRELTTAERENWTAAAKTMARFSDRERAVLLQLYQSDGPFADRVATVAQRFGFSAESVWHLSDRALKVFAAVRGLI